MRQRLDLGTALQGLGAALVLIALFLRWYDPGGTAWRVFEITDLLLAALTLAAIFATFGRLAEGELGTPAWVQSLGLAVLVIVTYEILDKPPAARDAAVQTGAWLALGGAILMALGGLLHRARIRISIDVRERDRGRRVAAVDRRAAEEADAASGPDATPVAEPTAPTRRRPARTAAGQDAPRERGSSGAGSGSGSGSARRRRDRPPADAAKAPPEPPPASRASLLDDDVERTQPLPPVEGEDPRA